MAEELTKKRAFASFLYKSLAGPLEKGARLVLVVVAAPVLGATAFGVYQFASTVTSLLTSVTELGLGMRTTRALARSDGNVVPVLTTGLHLKVAAVAPYALLVLLLAMTEDGADRRLTMVALGAAALASAFVDYAGAVFRGREDFRDEAVLNSARAGLTTAGALAGLWATRTVVGLSVGLAVGAISSAALGLGTISSRYGLRRAPQPSPPEDARAVLREAVPLWISGLLATLYFRSDIVIVRYFAGDAEVGAYAAAYRIFEGTMLLPGAVMAVAFPRLAREGANGGGRSGLEAKLLFLLVVLGLGAGGVLLALDARLVRVLLGATFERSAASLRVLAFTIPVMFASYAVSYFVMARGRERGFIVVLGLMLVLNVALNLVLVPRMGGVGAAWATLVTEAALILGSAVLLARRETPAAAVGT